MYSHDLHYLLLYRYVVTHNTLDLHCIKGDTILYGCLAMLCNTTCHIALLQHIPFLDALYKWWNIFVCMLSRDIHYLLTHHFVAKQHAIFALYVGWDNIVRMFSHDIHYLLSYRFVPTHNTSSCIALRVLQFCVHVQPCHTLPTVAPLRCNTQHTWFALH